MSALDRRASWGSRVAAIGVVGAALAAPLTVSAFADAAFAPDFASSTLTSAGTAMPLSSADGKTIQPVSVVKVKFTDAVTLTQTGNGVPLSPTGPDRTAAAPYFADPATPATQVAATAAVDPTDPDTVDVTPTNPLADGTYELHVTAFAASACPAAAVSDVTYPACTTYDDFVMNLTPAAFTFTSDGTAPTVVTTTITPASIDADHVQNVTVSGTTDSDTTLVRVFVKSSGGGATRKMPNATITPGDPASWSVSDDLSKLPDGTLTFTALGTDGAGNVSDPTVDTAAVKTAPMAAHPSAPRSVAATSADSAAKVTWLAPTTVYAGHPVIGYTMSATDNSTHSAVFKQVACSNGVCPTGGTVSGLTNGDDYTVAVVAVTDVGHGVAGTTTVRPKAATTLTERRSARSVHSGHKVVLDGRLSRTRDGSAIAGITMKVTPRYTNGHYGTPFTVKTDIFGVWTRTLRPTRTATYIIRWPGNGSTLPSSARTKVTVTS